MKQKLYPLEALFGTIITPFERFLRQTTSGGIILVVMTICTLLIANSPWGHTFQRFWERPVGFTFDSWILERPLREWINEGLMALFFLVVGLELNWVASVLQWPSSSANLPSPAIQPCWRRQNWAS